MAGCRGGGQEQREADAHKLRIAQLRPAPHPGCHGAGWGCRGAGKHPLPRWPPIWLEGRIVLGVEVFPQPTYLVSGPLSFH